MRLTYRTPTHQLIRKVETMGFEPTTPGLQSRCSARLSYVPLFFNL